MITFKTFWKCLKACKGPIILYTIILIFFGGFNYKTNEKTTNFEAIKPSILIINKDESTGITKDLISYLSRNSNIKDISLEEEKINDALFYRDINYIIYIPKNFNKDFLSGNNPKIEIKSSNNYESSIANRYLSRYLKIASTYLSSSSSETELINKINKTLEEEINVDMTTTIDKTSLSKITLYYNFASYSLLAGCVYVICLVLSSFRNSDIKKRTTISSTNYKKINFELLLSSGLFALILWLFYRILSFILIGNTIFSSYGLLYIINSFIFIISCLALAFLIGNLITNKNAINGIINVIALGSSFLCGAFVPTEYLPTSVLKFAHIFPTYYYIDSNEAIKALEVINIETLKPFLLNILIMVIFVIAFILLSNLVSRSKRRIS